jgi:hypothetical protein
MWSFRPLHCRASAERDQVFFETVDGTAESLHVKALTHHTRVVVLPELHMLFERVTLQSKRGKDPFASTGSYQYDVLEVELLLIACSVWSGMTV